LEEGSIVSPRTANSPLVASDGRSATTVLVVDDQEMMTELITVILHRIGFDAVEQAFDGPTALAMLGQRSFGLVISDLNMEPLSGLQLLEIVRKDEKLRHIPFLMTTASLDTANAAAAKAAGVDTYLLKPFTPDLLRAKVHATLHPDPGRQDRQQRIA
jgi:two-component system chemotaxis response regulator CheY